MIRTNYATLNSEVATTNRQAYSAQKNEQARVASVTKNNTSATNTYEDQGVVLTLSSQEDSRNSVSSTAQIYSARATSSSVLKVGSRGTAVTQLQKNLTTLGYDTKGTDGIFGNDTKNAVLAFQKAHGLTTDGIVGSGTQNAIAKAMDYHNKGILVVGSRGTAVTELQKNLTKLGYNTKGTDGIFGNDTKNAVIAFQKAHGLTADGMVGSDTQKAINNAIKNISSTSSNNDSGKNVNGLSKEGFRLLVNYEVGQGTKGVVYDKNNNIVSIPIMDVGDGKYTVGFGNAVDKNDAATIAEYKKKYGIDVTKIGEQVDVDTCRKIYNDHENYYTSLVDNLLSRNNYKATQNEYDALVIAVYNRPVLASKGHALDTLLKNNNKNKDDWRSTIMNDYKAGVSSELWNMYNKGWSNRVEDELELFFEGDYVRNH